MSKKEKRNFIRALLYEAVNVKGINCRVRLCDMFTRENNAVIVLRRRNGELLSIGF